MSDQHDPPTVSPEAFQVAREHHLTPVWLQCTTKDGEVRDSMFFACCLPRRGELLKLQDDRVFQVDRVGHHLASGHESVGDFVAALPRLFASEVEE